MMMITMMMINNELEDTISFTFPPHVVVTVITKN